MNPTDKHKEQAREIVNQHSSVAFLSYLGQAPFNELIDLIAAALAAKDAEIERLKVACHNWMAQVEIGRSSLAQKVLATVAEQKTVWTTAGRVESAFYAGLIYDALRDLFQKEGIEVK